jgi:hypothetical protein
MYLGINLIKETKDIFTEERNQRHKKMERFPMLTDW